MEKTEI